MLGRVRPVGQIGLRSLDAVVRRREVGMGMDAEHALDVHRDTNVLSPLH
ncbi:hypothetical protein [Alicyclobacillus macrosporangiidus]|nr:hypothetical protein [Alicyclobacillus macrosporangiidus]